MFAHQLLCNPKISTLLKATCQGFVRGCPNMLEKLILKYLNPSPATAKGHMKQPRRGIRSTTKMSATPVPPQITPVPVITLISNRLNLTLCTTCRNQSQLSGHLYCHFFRCPQCIQGLHTVQSKGITQSKHKLCTQARFTLMMM
jgi:hypothetical protein